MKSPEIVVEHRSVNQLISNVRNRRTPSDQQVSEIVVSIFECGSIKRVLVDGAGAIIAGRARVLAARKLGLKQMPVIVLDHLADSQKRTRIMLDNKLTQSPSWQPKMPCKGKRSKRLPRPRSGRDRRRGLLKMHLTIE